MNRVDAAVLKWCDSNVGVVGVCVKSESGVMVV